MKIHTCLPIAYFFILLSACEKNNPKQPEYPQPNVPCFDSFSCDLNGEPFETHSDGNCLSKYTSYDSIQKRLHVDGFDCNTHYNGIRGVVFEAPGVGGLGTFSIETANCGYVNNTAQPIPYNIVVGGEVKINGLIVSNYSEDWSGGYVEGTFWFTVYSEELKDTIKVTNGQFCSRI